MRPLRTVVIGVGRMGKTRLLNARQHGGFEIVGLCDVNTANAGETEIPFFSDWKQCIERCKPDVAFVCTYNATIPEVVCYALNHGIHVFSEKPPGRTLEEAIQMKSVHSNHQDLVLKFGFNHRYHNSVIEAKALIDSGELGEVVCARGVYGKAGNPNFAQEWRNNKELSGGGILLDQGIHMLDLLRYFVGDFNQVASCVDTLVWKELPTEDSAFALLRTLDGKTASFHSNALQWNHKFDLDIVCTKGYVALNGLLTSTKSYGEERITYYRKDLSVHTGVLGKPLEHTLCFDTDESWYYEVQEFYNAIVNQIPIKNGTADDAVKVMELIDMIYRLADCNNGIVVGTL